MNGTGRSIKAALLAAAVAVMGAPNTAYATEHQGMTRKMEVALLIGGSLVAWVGLFFGYRLLYERLLDWGLAVERAILLSILAVCWGTASIILFLFLYFFPQEWFLYGWAVDALCALILILVGLVGRRHTA